MRIRAARQMRGLTLQALGDLCGIDKGRLSQLENGLSLPGLAVTRRIALALGVTPQYLAWGEGAALPRRSARK